MANLPDNPNRDELLGFIAETNLEFATIGFVDFQGSLRGKYVSRAKLEVALDEISFPLSALALEPTGDSLFAPGVADIHSGFADKPARLLPETARRIPWEPERRNLLVMAEFAGEWAQYCPRNVYRRVYDRALRLGFTPCHAVELEFTLFDESAKSVVEKGYRNLNLATPYRAYLSLVRQGVQSEFYNELMDMCAAMRISLESLHEERGAGFMEAAIRHGEGVGTADSAVLFKTFAKIAAQRRGLLMSFMARWSNDADGQSGHIHFSLSDCQQKPVFYDPMAPDHISTPMRHCIGGLQLLMSDFLLMFAPNFNSYKRLVPGIFAPTSATWGIENRTAAIRAIPGSLKSSRIECRTPGADANPYLSIAAVMAASLYGIEHEVEPTVPSEINVYEADLAEELRLPASFAEAIKRFKKSSAAREFFGESFVEAYADTRTAQLEQFQRMVTDCELARFLELV